MTSHTSTDVLSVLRAQAWERAKGELRSCLVTFISGGDPAAKKQFERLDGTIQKFINTVEDDGLIE